MIRVLSERCPSLGGMEREHQDYLLSSMQKLDSPASSSGGSRWSSVEEERPVVVVVMGKASAAYVQGHWSDPVDRKALVAKPGPGQRRQQRPHLPRAADSLGGQACSGSRGR